MGARYLTLELQYSNDKPGSEFSAVKVKREILHSITNTP